MSLKDGKRCLRDFFSIYLVYTLILNQLYVCLSKETDGWSPREEEHGHRSDDFIGWKRETDGFGA